MYTEVGEKLNVFDLYQFGKMVILPAFVVVVVVVLTVHITGPL